MCEFMKGFRYQLVTLLRSFQNDEKTRRLITGALKKDLQIWKNCAASAKIGLPLPAIPSGQPVTAIHFISDAAGAAIEKMAGGFSNVTKQGDRGVVSLGFRGDDIFFAGGLKWPENLLNGKKDAAGAFFGGKSTFLESVGLMIPFLTAPEMVRRKYVRLFVDNTNLFHAWEKRHCSFDQETSIVIRCLHLFEAKLECVVSVEYTRRLSNPMAALADRLTRVSTTTQKDMETISHLEWKEVDGPFFEWLKDPVPDWDLPVKLTCK